MNGKSTTLIGVLLLLCLIVAGCTSNPSNPYTVNLPSVEEAPYALRLGGSVYLAKTYILERDGYISLPDGFYYYHSGWKYQAGYSLGQVSAVNIQDRRTTSDWWKDEH